jgi:FkbM family methyltransferase
MAAWWSNRRFDVAEVSLIAGLTAAIVTVLFATYDAKRFGRIAYVAYSAAQEGTYLKNHYGPSRYSRNEEEWVIRDYFQDRRNGVFVDVGANDYKRDSNTFYLETKLGWSGIAIDPQKDFAAGYLEHRPRTRFYAFFVSDVSDTNIAFYLAEANSLVASTDRDFTARGGGEAGATTSPTRATVVPTIRLTDLLDQAGLSGFDFLSIDVELAEPNVLAGFDINRFKPAFVCVEAHPQVRQQILDYFAAHGYVVVGRYLRADLQNLYFAPVDATAPPLQTRPQDPAAPPSNR